MLDAHADGNRRGRRPRCPPAPPCGVWPASWASTWAGARQRAARPDHAGGRSRRRAGAGRRAAPVPPAAPGRLPALAKRAAGHGQSAGAGRAAGRAGAGRLGPGPPRADVADPPTIAAHMAQSASTIPHVTNFDDADVTDLEALRKGVPPGYLGANVKLTTMPFVMKAVALALRRHPMLNASLDEENQQIVYKQYVNLGVAVDTPRGLVVPVVRNVDRMSIAETRPGAGAAGRAGPAAQFAIEELRGGTFTISNLGAVGGTYSTPIINHPEVAILLLGRSRWLPVVRDGKIEPRLMLPLSLSYDHRLVDGAAAGRFLNEVIDYLQSPGKLLL